MMTPVPPPIDDEIEAYVLGTLSKEEARAFAARLAASPTLRQRVAKARAAVWLLAEGLPQVSPAPDLRARILAAVRTPAPTPPAVLARQLLAHEAEGRQQPEALAEAADRACQRLRQRLESLTGLVGFNTLFARALNLATAEFPGLDALTVEQRPDACLAGVRAFAAAHEPAEAGAGLAAILANFIGLLVTFIGEDLGLRLVRQAWPEFAYDAAGGAGSGAGA